MNGALEWLVWRLRSGRIPRPLPGVALVAYAMEEAQAILEHFQGLDIEYQAVCRRAIPPLRAAMSAADAAHHSLPRKSRDRKDSGAERPQKRLVQVDETNASALASHAPLLSLSAVRHAADALALSWPLVVEMELAPEALMPEGGKR